MTSQAMAGTRDSQEQEDRAADEALREMLWRWSTPKLRPTAPVSLIGTTIGARRAEKGDFHVLKILTSSPHPRLAWDCLAQNKIGERKMAQCYDPDGSVSAAGWMIQMGRDDWFSWAQLRGMDCFWKNHGMKSPAALLFASNPYEGMVSTKSITVAQKKHMWRWVVAQEKIAHMIKNDRHFFDRFDERDYNNLTALDHLKKTNDRWSATAPGLWGDALYAKAHDCLLNTIAVWESQFLRQAIGLEILNKTNTEKKNKI